MTWFNGDIYRMPLTAAQTEGAIGMVEAIVPPGGGPVPHVHERSDETFYVICGEVEFVLDGEPERIDDRLLALLAKYDTVLPPPA